MTVLERTVMASREELLQSICIGVRITKDLLKQIYGFELTYPGFANEAIAALKAAGSAHARQYYEVWLVRYKAVQAVGMKEIATWYVAECEKKWEILQKGSEERRKQEEMKLLERKKQLLMQKSQTLTE